MESVIKQVAIEDCEDLAIILAHAYPNPNGNSEESINKLAQELRNDVADGARIPFYGAYRDGKLLGALKLHEFSMTLRAAKVRVGGIAGVCVHFLHKKEKVSRDLLTFALKHHHAQGINMVSLYPFQTAFYKNMGFGYGAMKRQYRIKPDAFPKGTSKGNIDYLTVKDRSEVLSCYQQYSQTRTGMFERCEADFNEMFNFSSTVVGVRTNGIISGYLSFRFKRVKTEYMHQYNLTVIDFVYNTPEALAELCTFLHSQSDQVHQIIINTQDEDFHYLFDDPTNGRYDSFDSTALESSVTAVGAMYRVLEVKSMLEELQAADFGPWTGKLKINVNDNFFESSNKRVLIHFNSGKITDLRNDGECDVEITLNIANFSSLLLGAVGFISLFNFGLVTLSDPFYLAAIHRLFAVDHKPRNDTNF